VTMLPAVLRCNEGLGGWLSNLRKEVRDERASV